MYSGGGGLDDEAEAEDEVELKGRAFARGNIANPEILGRKNLCVRKCNLRRARKRRKLRSDATYTYVKQPRIRTPLHICGHTDTRREFDELSVCCQTVSSRFVERLSHSNRPRP